MGWSCFGVLQSCKDNRETHVQEITTNDVRLFSYNSLRSATGHFHPSNKIGGGGFGVVYKGALRDETRIAIKCLSAESKQGTKEFLTEINMISNTRHPNLVQLIGCCVESGNRMLIYEYLENNSLASALLGSKSKRVSLDWPKRVAICLGVASGLAFLHEEAAPPIVHRDIKASNILLDENLHPKIGDFGLAKLFPENVTHLSTQVAGTIGYLAPEYALFGQLTKKADIYSFGVLVLEIISGRSSSKAAFGVELLVLVEWVWKLREEGRLLDIVDPELTEYPEAELLRFIKVALFCTQAAPTQRPKMKQVIEMLSKEVNLNEKLLTEPGVYRPHSSKRSSYGSLQKSSSVGKKGVQPVNPFATSTKFDSFQSVTQMLPR
ncbi:putative serine/threonine-protein kinase [Lycium barbarum]|uniref:putative serine/threonine-protein kinase n=1 Tax=Lycium barbarum TaxID=112863 RepID=UPI00293EB63A|nr:putative serine/threonine-protein kinase [Lycium barbarum]XP_060202309.1 putative serine/threonine-protein kinase [Lycium barbarum]XP_060202310.1 putative serine/threonine-protein kinase [Lycium barbarum]